MSRIRHNTITILAIAAVGVLAGTAVLPRSTLAQKATGQPAKVHATQASVIDAKSALLTASAIGYPDIRRAGLVGDLYKVEALDANGDTIHLYLDPDSGFVIRIEKE